MAAFFFSLLVLSSLLISGALYFDIVAATPLFLVVVGGVHVVVAIFFYTNHRHYHAVHKLVTLGRGELFLLAISNIILSTRIRVLRDHYRLRKCQGLVLTGQPLEALTAVEEYRREAKKNNSSALDVCAVEIEANLQLGQLPWANDALERARQLSGYENHEALNAVAAHLKAESGEPGEAVQMLQSLLRVKDWSLTKCLRARNLYWYGSALVKDGREQEGRSVLRKAHGQAPESYYGQLADRPF